MAPSSRSYRISLIIRVNVSGCYVHCHLAMSRDDGVEYVRVHEQNVIVLMRHDVQIHGRTLRPSILGKTDEQESGAYILCGEFRVWGCHVFISFLLRRYRPEFLKIFDRRTKVSMPLPMSVSFNVVRLVVRTSRSLAVTLREEGQVELLGETPNRLSASATLSDA